MRKILKTQPSNVIHTRSKRSLLSTTAMIAGALLMSSQVSAGTSTPTNSWDYDVVLDGNVGKDTSVAGITNITVTGGNGFVEGNADIYANHTVNVVGDTGSTFAYRDNRDNIQSTLNGDLNSNMNIVIIDKNGLFFGDDFNADVQGIVASTGNISVGDIMDGGELLIENIEEGGNIALNGTITVAEAGLAAFVAPHIQNNGIINAKLGSVSLAAGTSATVDLYGDGLVELTVNGELNDALIENNGKIIANGGTVKLTALAAKKIATNIVNNTGIISASSATEVGGKIILSGGNKGSVKNTGVILTSAGGSVDISGEKFVQGSTKYPSPTPQLIPGKKPNITYIKTGGGNVNIATSENVEIKDGYIDAEGGNIDINNEGIFYSAHHNTLRTTEAGTIELNQNKPVLKEKVAISALAFKPVGIVSSIQNAIDAIDNTGTGTNTINVGAGTYNEAVRADHDNLVLNGNNAGTNGYDVRSLESIIIPNSPGVHVIADNVTVDGFTISGGDPGIFVENADNASINNNIILGSATQGIYILNSDDAYIMGNDIDAVPSGIVIRDSDNAVIDTNKVTNSVEGIVGDNAGNLWVRNNDIVNASKNGIHVSNSGGTDFIDDIDIWKNRISGAIGSTGILVENSAYASVGGYNNNQYGEADSFATGNVITGVKDAIVMTDSDRAMVIYNTIHDIAGTGITVEDFSHATITKNIVEHTGSYGIYTENLEQRGSVVEISENIVTDIGNNTGGSGIFAWNTDNINISNNEVNQVNGTGIDLGRYLEAEISDNEVDDVSENGIFADGYNDDALGYAINVIGNNIVDTGGNGIQVGYTDDVYIGDNVVENAGADGIQVYNGSFVEISGNDVNNTGDDGIEVRDSGYTTITMNTLNDIGFNVGSYILFEKNYKDGDGADGIHVDNVNGVNNGSGQTVYRPGFNVVIADNNINNTSDDGIEVLNSGSTEIDNNVIYNAGDDGIRVETYVSGDKYYDLVKTIDNLDYKPKPASTLTDIVISNNTVDAAGYDGIEVKGGNINLLVDTNEISNSGDNGIFLITSQEYYYDNYKASLVETKKLPLTSYNSGEFNSLIVDNIVQNSGSRGLYVQGASHGDVVLEGNHFIDNPTGARFESGSIDLTSKDNPNSIIINNDFETEDQIIGLQFDNSFGANVVEIIDSELYPVSTTYTYSSTGLSVVDDTLGATSFSGFINKSPAIANYVRIEDGTLIDPETDLPIVIDGTFANWDGVVPNSFGNILPASVLQGLESRIYDADDLVINGRGQIFVGIEEVGINTIDNIQDFFRNIQFSDAVSHGASLTITGLPPLDGINLNDINPAAGEGAEAEKLANIDPAAGGNEPTSREVTCLEDVTGNMSVGTVSYKFGGSLGESLAGAAACSTVGL